MRYYTKAGPVRQWQVGDLPIVAYALTPLWAPIRHVIMEAAVF